MTCSCQVFLTYFDFVESIFSVVLTWSPFFFSVHFSPSMNRNSLCVLITASINLELLSYTKVHCRDSYHSYSSSHPPSQPSLTTRNLTTAVKLMTYKYFSDEPNSQFDRTDALYPLSNIVCNYWEIIERRRGDWKEKWQ